jgi:apolipoprotein N-acyltransferase
LRSVALPRQGLSYRALPFLGALISGIGLGLAFPKPDLHLLVWVALVPLLLALRGAGVARAWWLGMITGLVYRAVALYWLVDTMAEYGGLGLPVALAAATALIFVLASFIGVPAMLAAWYGPVGMGAGVFLSVLWVALEFLQKFPVGGFPWAFVGYAAGRNLVFMQAADLAGVYGLSAVAVFVNVALASLIAKRGEAFRLVAVAAVLVAAIGLYGAARLAAAPPLLAASPEAADANAGDALRVAVVQGNVAQGRKWDPASRASILADHLQLSARAAEAGARLVIWPESSIPNPAGLARDPAVRDAIAQTARRFDISIIVGSPHVDGVGDDIKVTNAAFLIAPDGSWRQRYDKVRLVPFGEVVPLRRWLPWIAPLVVAVGDFHPGDLDQPLFGDPELLLPAFSVAICYEIVFPGFIRRQVRRGASFLVTITNDAWYGTSSGPYQHFAMARMRAVENRRYVVRAANTGISGIVDPWGRVRAHLDLEQKGMRTFSIFPRTSTSPYVLWGDLFAVACVLLASVGVIVRRQQKRATFGK